jgi:hypothetical protein
VDSSSAIVFVVLEGLLSRSNESERSAYPFISNPVVPISSSIQQREEDSGSSAVFGWLAGYHIINIHS